MATLISRDINENGVASLQLRGSRGEKLGVTLSSSRRGGGGVGWPLASKNAIVGVCVDAFRSLPQRLLHYKRVWMPSKANTLGL